MITYAPPSASYRCPALLFETCTVLTAGLWHEPDLEHQHLVSRGLWNAVRLIMYTRWAEDQQDVKGREDLWLESQQWRTLASCTVLTALRCADGLILRWSMASQQCLKDDGGGWITSTSSYCMCVGCVRRGCPGVITSGVARVGRVMIASGRAVSCG